MITTARLPAKVALAVLSLALFGQKRRVYSGMELEIIACAYGELESALRREAEATRNPLLRALYHHAARWLAREVHAINTMLDSGVALIGELRM